ncbi:MAG: hypothetical protein HYW25_03580 [Candidatus Aenigmarchaeota archaeon]|nr:hypothetical protein [Candidatus Aenigmarchaeota archaeon]
MAIELSRYDGRYVDLSLSCGTCFFGRLRGDRGRYFIDEGHLFSVYEGGDLDSYLADIADKRRGEEVDFSTNVEIAPEHVTSIGDISDEVRKYLCEELEDEVGNPEPSPEPLGP